MEIVKPSQIHFVTTNYYGVCKNCGCEFKTRLDVAKTLTGSFLYRNIDHLDNLNCTQVNNGISCECPACGYRHAHLTKTE